MNGRKAPAAVVGVQIDYDKFAQNFMDVTTGSGGAGYKVLYLLLKTTFSETNVILDPIWRNAFLPKRDH
jgi:hypothetical protein